MRRWWKAQQKLHAGKGKPDDQLGEGGGFARSEPAQLETIPATNVVLGDHTANKFIGKSLCKALA